MQIALDDAIKQLLQKSGRLTSLDLARFMKLSRQAAHKKLASLVRSGKLSRIGSTRGTYYVARGKKIASGITALVLANKDLEEHAVLKKLEQLSNKLKNLPKNTKGIFDYAFSEMLNNAIEHSRSSKIHVSFFEEGNLACFAVEDKGIGVYKSIIDKFGLSSELEAVQEILKGKTTTAKKGHSGEGIFFTEKIADHFELVGGKTALIIDNLEDDMAIKETEKRKGTQVIFKIKKHSTKSLYRLFNEYTDEEYKFIKTKVIVKLYEHGVNYVSRSQARRLLYGMERFSIIVLDFKDIKGIGQGFADEIFRVYARSHPKTKLIPQNASPAVLFMIKRALAGK